MPRGWLPQGALESQSSSNGQHPALADQKQLATIHHVTDCPGEETHNEYGKRCGRLHERDQGGRRG